MTDRHDDTRTEDEELARVMRAGLTARAEEAPDRLSRPPGSPRAARHLWPLAAAASVVLLLAVPLAVRWGGTGDPPPSGPGVVDEPPVDTAGWRVESYGGIQVRVPREWGWGGAPLKAAWAGGEVLDCGAAPFVVAGDPDYESVPRDTPYVGRPAMMTDVCATVGQEDAPEPPAPRADSVWIGAAVEPGTEQLGNGYVRETVAVGESTTFGAGTVTVTSDDPALRRAVLATAEPVEVDAHGCRADAVWSELPSGALGRVEPDSLSVCLYDSYGGATTLVWSDRLGAERARDYAAAVEESSALYDPVRLCTEPPAEQWMAIGVNGPDGTTAWTAVVMGECGQVLWHQRLQDGAESLVASPVEPTTVEPWAVPAVRAYVVGPSGWEDIAGGQGASTFRGMLG